MSHDQSIPLGATARMGSWVAGLKFEDVPHAVMEHAKVCLLDTLGCGLFGSTLEWSRIMTSVAKGLSGGGAASLIGANASASPSDAALVNGTAMHGFEIDDVHMRAHLHPGAVTIPAVFALAEARQLDGRAVLTAIVAGYEIGARVGMCAGAAHQLRGFHPTGTVGCLAAAAGAARILGLNATQSTHALGIAATQAAGLSSAVHSGAMSKRMHAGRAAQSGVLAALLAEQGYTGSSDVLETPVSGFMSTLSDGHDVTPFAATLGHTWETAQVGFKAYAACASAHTTIDALDAMMKRGLTANRLEKLTARMSKVGLSNVAWQYVPTTVTGAQMSAYFAAAVKLLDGEAFVEQYRDDRVNDPAIMALIGKMEFVHEPAFDAHGSALRHAVQMEVQAVDGEQWSEYVEQRRGSAEHPLPRDEVERKFRMTARSVLSQSAVEELLQQIGEFEQNSDLSRFCVLLRNSPE